MNIPTIAILIIGLTISAVPLIAACVLSSRISRERGE